MADKRREVFFTAGHCVGFQPDFDAAFLARHNSMVGPRDVVWHLGGGVWDNRIEEALTFYRHLTGRRYYVAAPGDPVHFDDPRCGSPMLHRFKDEGGFSDIITGRALARHGTPLRVPLNFGLERICVEVAALSRIDDASDELTGRYARHFFPRPPGPRRSGEHVADHRRRGYLVHGGQLATGAGYESVTSDGRVCVDAALWGEPVPAEVVLSLLGEQKG